MLTKPLEELEYERTLSIGVTYVPAYAGEAVGFGGNLGSDLCPCWIQRSPIN